MNGRPRSLSIDELVRRVMARTEREEGCLIWTGCLSTGGVVPVARWLGSMYYPRRILWQADGRAFKPGHVFAEPKCDQRCINPSCQIYVSKLSAMRRAAARGRLKPNAAQCALRAARCHMTRYSDDTVAKLRERYVECGNAAQVAREFGISHSHVHRIVTGVWRKDRSSPFAGLAA